MEWILAFGLVLGGLFVYNGLRTRCPNCGVFALHKRDQDGDSKVRAKWTDLQSTGAADAFDRAGLPFGAERNKPGFATARFRCSKCRHEFDRRTAVLWGGIARKVGDDKALSEYRSLKRK